jgi:hypothetical protein
MFDEPSFPFVQVLPLVQTVAVLYEAGAGPEEVHDVPFGRLAETHAWKTAISSAVGASAGAGGMGFAAFFIRARQSAAMVIAGFDGDGRVRSSYVKSGGGEVP